MAEFRANAARAFQEAIVDVLVDLGRNAEAGELLLGQLQADRHGFEAAPVAHGFQRALVVVGLEQLHGHESAQRVLEVRHLFADQLELVGGAVERQRVAVAVEDQAPAGRQRLDADAIALREVAEVLVPDDLQVQEAREERGEADEDHRSGGDDAPAEQALFGPVILQAYGA